MAAATAMTAQKQGRRVSQEAAAGPWASAADGEDAAAAAYSPFSMREPQPCRSSRYWPLAEALRDQSPPKQQQQKAEHAAARSEKEEYQQQQQRWTGAGRVGGGEQQLPPSRAPGRVLDQKQQQLAHVIPHSSRPQQSAAIRNNLAQQLQWFQQLEEEQLKLLQHSFKRELEEQQPPTGQQELKPWQETRQKQQPQQQPRERLQHHQPEGAEQQQQKQQLYGLPLCACGALLGPTDSRSVSSRGTAAAKSAATPHRGAATPTPPLSLEAFVKLRRHRLQGWGRPAAAPMGAATADLQQQQQQQRRRDVLAELLQGVRARTAERRRQQRERHEKQQQQLAEQQQQEEQQQQPRGSRSCDGDAALQQSSGCFSSSNSSSNSSGARDEGWGSAGVLASRTYSSSSSNAYHSYSRPYDSSSSSFYSGSSNPYSNSSSWSSSSSSNLRQSESPLPWGGTTHAEEGQQTAGVTGWGRPLWGDSSSKAASAGQQLQNGRDPRLQREIAAACPVESRLLAACNRRVFGNSSFRPMQREVIEAVLCKRDVFVVMATGGGKSLCYQLPAVLSQGLTVVVMPLLSLMMDQLEQLQLLNIGCRALVASQTWEEQRALYDDIRREAAAAVATEDAEEQEATATAAGVTGGGGQETQKLKLLLATPEKLQSSRALRQLLHDLYMQQQLCRFVIDEAHCVSQWGNDFRPDYCHLCSLRRDFPEVPLLALTATATQQVLQDVTQQLHMREPLLFQGSFDRPNLRYEVRPKNPRRVVGDIASLIKKDFEGMSGIVYCLSKRECERVAEGLQQQGISTAFYHAQLEPQRREEVQRDWMNDDLQVVVATLAFGMGINKRDVRFVVHCAMPKSLENFYQESGRAGRDGQEATCVLFYEYHDKQRQAHLIHSSSAEGCTSEQQRQRNEKNLLRMLAYCEEEVLCRRQFLLQHFGEHFNGDCRVACDNCSKRSSSDFSAALQTLSCSYEAQQVVDFVKECRQRCGGISLTMSSLRDFLMGKRGSSRSRSGAKGSSSSPDIGSLRLFGALGRKQWTPHAVSKLLKQLVIHQVLRERCVSTGGGNSSGFSTIVAYVEVGCREKEAAQLVSSISLFSSSSSSSSSPGSLSSAAAHVGDDDAAACRASTPRVPFSAAAAAAAAKRKVSAALRCNSSSNSSDLDEENNYKCSRSSYSSSSSCWGINSSGSNDGGISSNDYKRHTVGSSDGAEVWGGGRSSKRQRSGEVARFWVEQQQQRRKNLLIQEEEAEAVAAAAGEAKRQPQVLPRQVGGSAAGAGASTSAAAAATAARSVEGRAPAETEDSSSCRTEQLRLSAPLQKMLQEKLKNLRQQLAQAHAIKNASSIASQHTLTQLSLHLPVTAQQLLALEGVRDLQGEHKMKKYGVAFVEQIRSFVLEQHPLLLTRLERRRVEQQSSSSPSEVGSSRKPCSASTAAFTQRLLQRQIEQQQQPLPHGRGSTSLFAAAPPLPYCSGEASFLTLGGRSSASAAAAVTQPLP